MMQATVTLAEMFDKVCKQDIILQIKMNFFWWEKFKIQLQKQDFIDQETKFLSLDKLHFQ